MGLPSSRAEVVATMKILVPFLTPLAEFALLFVVPSWTALAREGFTYDAVVFDAGPSSVDRQLLKVFPLGSGKELRILLPNPVGILAIAPDGRTLYARPTLEDMMQPKPGLLKIELNPARESLIPGSAGFVFPAALALWPSQDRLLVSGPYVVGPKAVCGVYEFTPASGAVRKLLDSADCRPSEAWTYPSLSPDGSHAVAIHKNQLDLVDLVRREVKPLGEGFEMAAWSPNGKWIAAREHTKEESVILFDARTFARVRALKKSEVLWSPDSRYLLAWKWQFRCGPEIYSLEKIEVETGKRSIIESSSCKASGGIAGWVSTKIAPQPTQ
jgi:hypothetical protein